jgi:molybdate/tungstate transport system substrate-binding protein
MKKLYVAFAVVAIVILLSTTYFFVANNVFSGTSKQILKIHCATSLLFPLEKVEADFESAHPDVDVEIEGHGTIQVIRHVTELNQKIDLLLVADYVLIPRMMYDTKMPNTDESFANYYIRFATNSLVLAYTNQSKYANEINSDNWYSILARQDVKLGLANPQLAAIGYRALIAIQLAEDYYGEPNLFHDIFTANLEPPISSVKDGSNYTIFVPGVQNPKGDKLTLRGSEVDLIALLQPGFLDYCLIYLSNAKQYGFNYIELPDEINMGSPQYESNYGRVEVVHEHQRFATVNLDRVGETIYYGLTIPRNAPNAELAEEFSKFILEGQGKTDFDLAYHPVFTPAFTDNPQAVPTSLQSLVEKEP